MTIAEQKALVTKHCSHYRWHVPKLLQEMRKTPDFYFGAAALVRMSDWSKDRVVLVGDAACCPSPLSGHGTSLALVGAYALAAEIKRHSHNHQLAFSTNHKRMREFVTLNQNLALRNLPRIK
jgi:2-polyprenyl-6-methoxyphenol hydroxylase-like FAD-dependent oxidoreductase